MLALPPSILVALALAADVNDARVDALLARMTLEEKIGQLTQIVDDAPTGPEATTHDGDFQDRQARIRRGEVGALINALGAGHTNDYQRVAVRESRLGIPLLFGYDVIHGYATIFPVPLAQAATWDPDLVQRAEQVAAREASADGVRWTFAPMVDIARDPRWGRIMEGAGEDPYLGAALAAARVRGFQGDDLSAPDRIVACAKHFAAYGAAEGGRDYDGAEISERTLREVYFPPFRAALAAGVGTFMSSFNEIAGTPATASRFLFTDVLRREWGFAGFVVSDWGSIDELRIHGVAADRASAARLAMNAGVDMDMVSSVYLQELPRLVRAGTVSIQTVDQAVRRVLRIKARAGLFAHPYTDESRAPREWLAPAHRALAREVARRSIVLLQNQGDRLPLAKNLGTLAVIGPLADDRADPLGEWAARGDPHDVVTLLEGVRAKVGRGTRVIHAAGTDVEGKDRRGIAEAVAAARRADVVLLAVGEGRGMSGEAQCRATLDLPGAQKDLVEAVAAAGKPTVLVVSSGRPLTLAREAALVPAVLQTWLLGTESGNAIADVLFGDENPSGKLPVTFPRALGQLPIYYNHKNTGRPFVAGQRYTSHYLDTPVTPQWPFGFGLSYARFAYSNLGVSPARLPAGGQARVSATVENVGQRAGAEVVQLYLHDLVASTARPVKELRGFHRVTLEPGEKRTVTFTVGPADLAVLDTRYRPTVEPGIFRVFVGPSSADGLEATLEVTAP